MRIRDPVREGLLRAGGGGVIRIEIKGNPGAKARHRTGGRSRNPYKPDAAEERGVAWEMRSQYRGEPLDGDVQLSVAFYRENRKPIDLDNMVKRVKDAANGILWKDDRQVVDLWASKRVDPDNPRTVITAEEVHQNG